MKQRILIMSLLAFTALGTLYALDRTSNTPNRHPNGFKRRFLDIQARVIASKEYDMEFRELCGQSGDSLFLMTGLPGKVFITDPRLTKLSFIALKNPHILNLIPRFYTMVNFPEVNILGGNASYMAKWNLKTGQTVRIPLHLPGIFNTPTKLKDGSYVLQLVDSSTMNARFIKIDMIGKVISVETEISKRLHDAGFIHSGMLKYDSQNDQLVYMHFFDNHIDVFNADLQLLYRSTTIDTNRHEKVTVSKSGKMVTYRKPPVAINGHAEIYKGALYVRSKLKADNETESFWYNTVIDKYSLQDGKYLGSFYLPNRGLKQIGQFYFIADNQILALYDKQIMIYKLNVTPVQKFVRQ